jgi:DNA polymerase III delta prime subunit
MRFLVETFANTGTIHHAYCIEGDKETILNKLNTFFKEHLNFNTEGNPDYWQNEYDTLGIDDSRMVKEIHSMKPLADNGRRIYVILVNSITHEAQNALLKIFEEPQEGNHFFIIMPSAEILLPTLKSRMHIIKDENRKNKAETEFAKLFIESPLPQRLEMTKEITDAIKDEKQTKAFAISFLNTLEMILREKIGVPGTEHVFVFNEILKAKSYLGDRSSSVKTILDHVSLIVPR